MYKSERFKFGEITPQSATLPSVAEVHDALEGSADDTHETPDPSIQQGSADAVVLKTDHDGYSYCHFQYRIVPDTDGTPDEEDVSQAQADQVCSRVFYFENGQFAVQPTRGVSDRWLPSFIGQLTDTDVGTEFRFYEAPGVCRNTDAQGTHTASPLAEAVGNRIVGDETSVSTSTVIESNQDTTPSNGDPADLLDETAQRIRAVEPQPSSDDSSDAIISSGTVVATWDEADWPSNVDEARRAQAIYEQILPYLQSHN